MQISVQIGLNWKGPNGTELGNMGKLIILQVLRKILYIKIILKTFDGHYALSRAKYKSLRIRKEITLCINRVLQVYLIFFQIIILKIVDQMELCPGSKLMSLY